MLFFSTDANGNIVVSDSDLQLHATLLLRDPRQRLEIRCLDENTFTDAVPLARGVVDVAKLLDQFGSSRTS